MCITKFCRKPKYKGNYCHSCKKRRYKEKHPEKYAYIVLKNNARRRGKYFDLTFEQFLEFSVKSGYMAGKGIYKESLHIDRIDESKGYTIDNIQVLSNIENVKKYLTYNYDKNGVPCDFKIKKSVIIEINEDDPF